MNIIMKRSPRGRYVFKKEPNKDGQSALYLQYYVGNRRVMGSTGIFIRPNQWDSKKQVVKSTHPNYKSINVKLKKIKTQFDEELFQHDGKITIDVIKAKFKNEDNDPDFVQFALDYNEKGYMLEKKSYSTFDNHRSQIRLFQKYLQLKTGKSVLPMSKISEQILDNYKMYCRKKGNQKESLNKNLTPLFKAIKYAAATELISSKLAAHILEDGYLPLKNTKYESAVRKEKSRYLTESQLQEFSNLYYTVKFPRTKDYIDIFMFSFYTCGMRFADLLTLEWRHIDWTNKQLTKNLFKSKEYFTVPLLDPALEILKRWKKGKCNKRFVFGLLPENFDLHNEAELDKLRKSKNRSLHTSLNTLGKKLSSPLSFSLSIHVARHTFAVMALNHGTGKSMLSKLMAHKSVVATEKTYAMFLPDTVKEEVLTNLNFDFSPQSLD